MACTITEIVHKPTKQIKFAWSTASSSSGAATGTTTGTYSGKVIGAMFEPSTSAAPSASYDVTVKTASSIDILWGAGASLAASNVYKKEASLGQFVETQLTIAVANAGSSNAGAVYVFFN